MYTPGLVSLDCRPGPPTVLTSEEETRLAEYCVATTDMGFGLTREGVMAMAFAIAVLSSSFTHVFIFHSFTSFLKHMTPGEMVMTLQ